MKRNKQIRVEALWRFLGEECMTDGTLVGFEKKRPEFIVSYDHNNSHDKNAMLVKSGRKKIGYINADDIRFLEPLMVKNKCFIKFDHIVWPQHEGDCASMKCTVEVDMDKVKPLVHEVEWDNVKLSAVPLAGNSNIDDLEQAVTTLHEHLDGTARPDDMTPEDCVAEIEDKIRFDMSRETTDQINELCLRLEIEGSEVSIALLERIEAASTFRRSRRNLLALQEWIEEMMESEEADEQWTLYVTERMRELKVSKLTAEQLQKDMDAYEQELLNLPCELRRLRNEPERLLHATFYKGITRKKQKELVSQLVLVNSLKEYVYSEEVENGLSQTCEMQLEEEWEEEVRHAQEPCEEREEVVEVCCSFEEELAACFYGNIDKVREFLNQIEGIKPSMITRLVKKLVKEKVISEYSCHRTMWNILHSNGLYKCTESNWNNQVG